MIKKQILINRIGTSGWYYEHWKKHFYPETLSKSNYLSFYANNFLTVEINNTFYRLPNEKTFINWYSKVPHNFIFSIKASRYITHIKRLKDAKEPLETFLQKIKPLKEKLGPILFQLPPSFKLDLARMEAFLNLLPKDNSFVFEFRHISWWVKDVFNLMKKFRVAFCISDIEGMLAPLEVTGLFVYIRLHGPSKNAYKGSYTKAKIADWAKKIESWNTQGFPCYCYFDNDEAAYAAKNALQLQKKLILFPHNP